MAAAATTMIIQTRCEIYFGKRCRDGIRPEPRSRYNIASFCVNFLSSSAKLLEAVNTG